MVNKDLSAVRGSVGPVSVERRFTSGGVAGCVDGVTGDDVSVFTSGAGGVKEWVGDVTVTDVSDIADAAS